MAIRIDKKRSVLLIVDMVVASHLADQTLEVRRAPQKLRARLENFA